MPRTPEGDRPLTDAERQKRQRKRKAEREQMLVAALTHITLAETVCEAREIARSALCTKKQEMSLALDGNDNYGKPKQDYADKLVAMDEAAFLKAAEQAIWLSAYASNNPRSDYHWQASACYDEAGRRGRPELYSRAFEAASGS
jgi:hypothetical protein